MVWQRNDDQYGVSKKITRIPRRDVKAPLRLAAVGLDQLAMNYSVRALTDGVLDESELDEVLATRLLIAELVRVGRWHQPGHDCESCVQPPAGGVVIHDFLVYNPDAASVLAGRSEQSAGGKHGNHVRWHEARGIADPTCEWCATGMRSPKRSKPESEGESVHESLRNPPGPVPGPVPQTDTITARPPSTDPAAREGDRDEIIHSEQERLRIKSIDRLRRAFMPVVGSIADPLLVIGLTEKRLIQSKRHVRSVEAYIETACTNSPGEIREDWEALTAEWAAVRSATEAIA